MLDVKTSPDTMPQTLLRVFDVTEDGSHLSENESNLPHGLSRIAPGTTQLGVKVSKHRRRGTSSVFAVVSELRSSRGNVVAYELVEVNGSRTMTIWR